MSDYHSDHMRISNSMLSVLKQSPKLFMRQFIAGQNIGYESRSMQIGTLLHAIVLEPDSFDEKFIGAPKIDRRTKDGKSAWEAFIAEANGKQIVDIEDVATARTMADSIKDHAGIKRWLDGKSSKAMIEKRIDFDWLGVPCKSKPDYFNPLTCIDLKTCVDPSPEGFQRSVFKYGYHRQAAFYSIAINEVYGWKPKFLFACVGNSEPYDTAVYMLEQDVIEQGQSEIEALLREYKARLASGKWSPEWSEGVCRISKPRWYDANIYETESEEAA